MQNSTPTSNVETQRYHLTVLAGSFAVTIRPPLVHIAWSGSPCGRFGPPQLFHGRRADHLTIPLAPMRDGPMAGLINIHLTYSTGRRRHHQTVAALAPQAIEAAFRPVVHGILSYYVRSARRVTVEDLQREGYRVLAFSNDAERWLDERTSPGRWRERLTNRKLEGIEQHLELYDPQVLDDLHHSGGRQSAILVRETDGVALSVGYNPTGLGPDHPPGWYAVPVNRGIFGVFEELLSTAFGPELFDTLIVIARELQVGIDLDGVTRARTRALSAQSAHFHGATKESP